MKRSSQLSPLSREHHVALEHALRLRRAGPEEVPRVVAQFLAYFVDDGECHFASEEEMLLPAVPDDEDRARKRVLAEHAEIRRQSRTLGEHPSPASAATLGKLLAAHIRFEEREVFPMLEARLSAATLDDIGRRLTSAA